MLNILDLDRVARAYDQRAVPLAIGRFGIVIGAAFLMVGLWPPAAPSLAIQGVVLVLVSLSLSLPFWQPRAAWVAVGGGILAMVFSGLLLASAVWSLTVAAEIVPPAHMDAAVREGLTIANRSFKESPWMLARVIAALLSVFLALELFLAGLRLIRVSHLERDLLVERAPGPWSRLSSFMLDFPPGMIRYSRHAILGGLLLLIGMLPFFFALTNIGGAAYLDNLLALVRVIDCVEAETDLEGCIEINAWEHALGISVLALGSLFLLPWIGFRLHRLAGKTLARSAMARFGANFATPGTGTAILFLRPVRDDSVALLPAAGRKLIRNALSPSARLSGDLDYLLVAEGMVYGMPVGLGDGSTLSFGAVRFVAAEDQDLPIECREWARTVKALTQRSQRIILVVDDSIRGAPGSEVRRCPQDAEHPVTRTESEGLRWELCHLARNPDLLAKTTILVKTGTLASKRAGRDRLDAYRSLWGVIEELTGLRPPHRDKPVIGLSFSSSGGPTALIAERFYATTALMSLRFALRGVQSHRNAV